MNEAHEQLRTTLYNAANSGDVGHDAALSVLRGIEALAGPMPFNTENNLLGSSVKDFMVEAGISSTPRIPRGPADPRLYPGIAQPGLEDVLWDRDAWDQQVRSLGLNTGREYLDTPAENPAPM